MAQQNTATHELPTSEWDHSHALEEGSIVSDTETGAELCVETINDDGSAVLRDLDDGVSEEWTEEEIRVSLRDGLLSQDGLTHELATY